MKFKFIKKIGIELEGGWIYPPSSSVYEDISVNISGNFIVGEISSPPFNSLKKALQWVTLEYPAEVNRTCGLHIHISLKNNLHYSKLMSLDFYNFFLAEVTKWGDKNTIKNPYFWSRLSGYNRFCRRHYNPDVQVTLNSKENARRTHLNYCFKFHSTIECRLFPMFKDKRISCKAIEFFCECVETFLEQNKGKEKPVEIEIPLDIKLEKLAISEEI